MSVVATVANAATYTATVSGNWSSSATWSGGVAPGNNITLDNIIIPGSVNVILDEHVTLNGVLASLDVSGSLVSATTDSLEITSGALTGNGSMTLEYLSFGTLGTMTFTGSLDVNTMDNSSLSLSLASNVQINDTLFLQSGSVTIGTGANLTLASSSNIKIDNGSIVTSGGILSSSNSYNVIYIGASKSSGVELNGTGLSNIYVQMNNNTQMLTLMTDVTSNGIFYHQIGNVVLNGYTLTLKGDYISNSGVAFNGSATSSIVVNSTNSLTNSINFATGANTVDQFEVNITSGGNVNVGGDLNIGGKLLLTKGTVTVVNSSTLTAVATSEIERDSGSLVIGSGSAFDGSASYDVSYYGTSKTMDIESSGAGLNSVMIDLDAASDSLNLYTDLDVAGTLNINSGGLDLSGYDLDIQGGYSAGVDGSIRGDAQSDLTVSSATQLSDTLKFYNGHDELNTLTVNVTDGSFVVVGSSLTLENLSLISGGLTLNNNNLTINSTGSITGNDVNNYIRINGTGSLVRTVAVSSPYVEFPVGNNINYSPVSIQQSSGVSDKFSVNIKNGVWSMGASGFNSANTESVVNRTWNISRTLTSATSVNLKMEWVAAAEVNGFDRTKSYISHYTSGAWDMSTAANATLTGGGTYQITRTGITSLSPFAVVDTSAHVGIEESELSVSGVYPNPVKDQLTYSINTAQPVLVELMDITGNIIYSERLAATGVVTTKTLDFSTIPSGIYMIRFNTTTNQVVKRVTRL